MGNPVRNKLAEIIHNFSYHPPATNQRISDHEEIRAQLCSASIEIEKIVPDSRERSIALTKIEEAMFWANAGIARNSD